MMENGSAIPASIAHLQSRPGFRFEGYGIGIFSFTVNISGSNNAPPPGAPDDGGAYGTLDRTETHYFTVSWNIQRQTSFRFGNINTPVTTDSLKEDVKGAFLRSLESKKCRDAINGVLKQLGSSAKDIEDIYNDIEANGGFYESISNFSDLTNPKSNPDEEAKRLLDKGQAIATFDKKGKRAIVADKRYRTFSNETDREFAIYGNARVTLFHELLHHVRDGRTSDHDDIAKAMFKVSETMSRGPMGSPPLTDPTTKGTNITKWMDQWIQTFCPTVRPTSAAPANP